MKRSVLSAINWVSWLPLILLVVIITLWLVGGLAFQFSLWPFAGMFGPTTDLQNVFSPIGALFSGVAVWGAIYTIYTQARMTTRQQFESVFFNLLNIHNENRKNFQFDIALEENKSSEYLYADEAFLHYYNLLKEIYSYVFRYVTIGRHRCAGIGDVIIDDIEDNIEQSKDGNRLITLSKEKLFRLAYDIYTQYTDVYYSKYVRHVYHVLKYIDESGSSIIKKRVYIRIFRAQFSKYEMALLYYRAITSEDKREGSKKFKYQELIEKTSFLHLLCDDMTMLFDSNQAGQMDDSAFDCNHDGPES